jgi:hypothetical protein
MRVMVCIDGGRSDSHGNGPPTGPPSVGHTARFVVDHAPCPVLLVRPTPPPAR